MLSRSVKSVAGKAYLLTLSFEGVKESGLEGGVPFGIWGQLGSGVKVGRFRFWVGYHSSVLVIRSVSGDSGFAWMAFPVKFRVVSSVGSWP